MNPVRFSTILLALAIAFISVACTTSSSTEGERIEVTGVVLDQATDNPLNNVIVRQLDPRPEQYAITNANGEYTLMVPVDSLIPVRLSYILEGFNTKEMNLIGVPGRNIAVPAVRLSTGAVDEDDDVDPGPGAPIGGSGTPASIIVHSKSSDAIVVRESGGTQQAIITFVVTDSVGVPITLNRQTEVSFSLGGNPGGGVVLNPTTALTSGNGRASTILTSGTISGVVQVIASVTKTDGTVIRSRPVNVTISSGLPHEDHFSLASPVLNIPGLHRYGILTSITAFVGDRYGNVVSPGTSVYYTTNGGLIEGSALTDNLGRAVAALVTADPNPPGGFATIRGRTVDENNQNIEDAIVILFSGFPIITADPMVINVPNGGSQTIRYTVSDHNGNPLAAGNTFSVTVEGENMRVIGDTNIQMPDTQGTGPVLTEFEFTITDNDPDNNVEEPVHVTIRSAGPNGETSLTLTGTTRKTTAN